MATYLPEIQYASEREWAHRLEVVFPARAREAALLRADRAARPQGATSALGRLVVRLRGAGERTASPTGLGTALPLDRAV